MGAILFVTGPARSGKSRWAVTRAREWGPDVVFVATCRPGDPEMDDRIGRHRSERPYWRTIEAPGSVGGGEPSRLLDRDRHADVVGLEHLDRGLDGRRRRYRSRRGARHGRLRENDERRNEHVSP